MGLNTLGFFQRLFGKYAGPPACVSLWRAQDKLSKHIPVADLEHAARVALDWDAAGHDVYFGCGLRRPGLGARRRGRDEEVVAVPGFWCDLDIARPGEKPKLDHLPRCRDKEQALEVMRTALPVEPNLLVSSGWGYHAYWLFENGPQRWEDLPGGRERWASAHRRWNKALVQQGVQRGVEIDDVADSARVLRVVGTRNHKIEIVAEGEGATI